MFKKAGHIILVPLLLIATMGMTVNLHYCKHKLYDIGIFSQADNCCMPKEKTHHHIAGHDCQAEKHNANDCKNETIKIKSVDNFVVANSDFNFNQNNSQLLFAAYFVVIDTFKISENTNSDKVPKFDISPPRIQVVLSLLQTYLI